MHIHVHGGNGEAKFSIEPSIELAQNTGLSAHELSVTLRIIREHEHDIRRAWHAHFGN